MPSPASGIAVFHIAISCVLCASAGTTRDNAATSVLATPASGKITATTNTTQDLWRKTSFKDEVIGAIAKLERLRAYGRTGYLAGGALVWAGHAFLMPPVAFLNMPIVFALDWVYGFYWGVPLVFVCSWLGWMTTYLLVRAVGDRCDWKPPKMVRAKLVYMHERPYRAVIAARFLPLPPPVKNIGLALCKAPVLPYSVACAFELLPGQILAGSCASSAGDIKGALNVNLVAKISVFLAQFGLSAKILVPILVVLAAMLLRAIPRHFLHAQKVVDIEEAV